MDAEKLKKEQEKLSKRVVLKNDVDTPKLIAGADTLYTGRKVISVMIVFDYESMEKKEAKYTVMDANIPHMKEYAGFRQAPAAVETYHKLEEDPDVLIVQGTGILHPRRFGEASQIGLQVDKPAIGVAKELICGELKDEYIYEGDVKLGKMMITKEHAKPIYISPGHRVTLEKSVEFVHKFLGEKKLPIPIHEAHKYGNKIKRKLKDKS